MSTKVTRKDALLYGGAAAGGLVAGTAAVAGVAAYVEGAKPAQPVTGVPIPASYVGTVPADDPGA